MGRVNASLLLGSLLDEIGGQGLYRRRAFSQNFHRSNIKSGQVVQFGTSSLPKPSVVQDLIDHPRHYRIYSYTMTSMYVKTRYSRFGVPLFRSVIRSILKGKDPEVLIFMDSCKTCLDKEYSVTVFSNRFMIVNKGPR